MHTQNISQFTVYKNAPDTCEILSDVIAGYSVLAACCALSSKSFTLPRVSLILVDLVGTNNGSRKDYPANVILVKSVLKVTYSSSLAF